MVTHTVWMHCVYFSSPDLLYNIPFIIIVEISIVIEVISKTHYIIFKNLVTSDIFALFLEIFYQ